MASQDNPLDIDFDYDEGDLAMGNTSWRSATPGRSRTPAPSLAGSLRLAQRGEPALAPQPAQTAGATQTPRAAPTAPPAPAPRLAPTPRTVPGGQAPAAQSAPAAATFPRSRTPVPAWVRAHKRRLPRRSENVLVESAATGAQPRAVGPGYCGICCRSASTGMVDWAASAIVSGARVDVRDGCLRCVREVSILCPALPWPSAVQVASRSHPFRSCICISGAVREALAVSLRSSADVHVLLTQAQAGAQALGAAAAVEEIQGRSSLEDQLVEVSTRAEPRAALAAAADQGDQGASQALVELQPQLSRGRPTCRKRVRAQPSRGRSGGAQPEGCPDNHSLSWHQAKMPLPDVFLRGKNVKKLGNLMNAATASVDALNIIPARQPEGLALAKYVKIVAACDELGSGLLERPAWEHFASVVDAAQPQLPLVVPPASTTLIAKLLRYRVDHGWAADEVVSALMWRAGVPSESFLFRSPRLADTELNEDQKAEVFEDVVLNGIVWQAMRPTSGAYDVQKMHKAAVAIQALREAAGCGPGGHSPSPSSDAGSGGPDSAREPASAAVLDALDFASAMIMLVASVDDLPITEQCKHINVARSRPAATPRGNVGMLLGLPPWTTIVNTYLTAMLKEKEHENSKNALMESLSTASSDAAAGVVTNAVQKIRDWRDAATRDEWRRPLADAILTRARAVLECSSTNMNAAQLRAAAAMLKAILTEAVADGALPESAKSLDTEYGPLLQESLQNQKTEEEVVTFSTLLADLQQKIEAGTLVAEDIDAVKADEKCWDSRRQDVSVRAAAWAGHLIERIVRCIAKPPAAAPAAAPPAEAAPAPAAEANCEAPGAAGGVSSDATTTTVSSDATAAALRRLPELGMLILGKCPGAPELQTLLAAMHVLNAAEQMRSGLAHIEQGRSVTEGKDQKKRLCKSGVELLSLSQKHIPGPSSPDALRSAAESWTSEDAADVITRCADKLEEDIRSREAVLSAHRRQTCTAARVALQQKVDELQAVDVGSWKKPETDDWKQLRLRAQAFLHSWDPKAYHHKEKAVRRALALYEGVAKTNSEGEKEFSSAADRAKKALQDARERMNELTLLDGVVDGSSQGRTAVQSQIIAMNDAASGTMLSTSTVHPVLWAQVELFLKK